MLLSDVVFYSFVSVSDRFLADLDQIRRGLLPKEIEPRLEFLILGMRFLKLQVSLATKFCIAH